jgi:hypothetical protein
VIRTRKDLSSKCDTDITPLKKKVEEKFAVIFGLLGQMNPKAFSTELDKRKKNSFIFNVATLETALWA